jgi:uncharacterized protein
MKWQGRQGSRNIEDRRRSGSVARGGGIGLGGLLLLLVVGYCAGIDVTPLMDMGRPIETVVEGNLSQEDQREGEFVSVVLADTENVWSRVFADQLNADYHPPVLVLFSQVTPSPCGGASGATGPFYCPLDQKVYLDTNFFVTMHRQLGAGGDFAAAYVVAHEVGHHVQNELGILEQTTQVRARMSNAESNRVSVMVELQADCFAGIWSRYAQELLGTLERGDVAEAMNAAKQIGDDTLQRNAGRRPMPHTFTHGTSQQRQEWYARGYQTGRLDQCDTFSDPSL